MFEDLHHHLTEEKLSLHNSQVLFMSLVRQLVPRFNQDYFEPKFMYGNKFTEFYPFNYFIKYNLQLFAQPKGVKSTRILKTFWVFGT